MSTPTQQASSNDAATTLQSPPVTVSLGGGYIAKEDCTLDIRCPDRHFRDAIVSNANGDKLFSLEAKDLYTSWSVRRSLKDASGQHIMDLRHYKSKLKEWVVEDPQRKELCIIKDSTKDKITVVDAQVPTDAGHTAVSMRSFDHAGTKTVIDVEGVAIAELILIENNDVSNLHKRNLDRSVWKLRMVGGSDMALVLALAFCRAEICHAFRR